METLQTSGNRIVEPIVLDNGLLLDGEAGRGVDGKYLFNSMNGWKEHYAGTEKRLPTVAELISCLWQSEQKKDSVALQGMLRDMKEDWLCAGKINYNNSNLPVGNGYLVDLVRDHTWKKALEDELFQYDAPETIDMLQRVSGKRPYIWTPDATGRKSNPERAVWLSINTDRFNLYCYDNPIYDLGRARGVREGGAEGDAQKKGSASPATTEEERLELRLSEALSPFDKFKSPATQQAYEQTKQQVMQDLRKLYHG